LIIEQTKEIWYTINNSNRKDQISKEISRFEILFVDLHFDI